MKERRRYERLTISIPVRLETITTSKKEVFDLETTNISASGTFLPTLASFPQGTRFILDFTIPTDKIKKYNDMKHLKGYTGSMVRSTPRGISIQFDKEYQIESLKAL